MTSEEKRANIVLIQEENLSFGDRLKTSREAAKLSVADAASRLHLSPKFINLLENENLLTCTLPPIYLRGYLRSYARLLNLPELEITSVLSKLEPTPAALTPASTSTDTPALAFPLEGSANYARVATVFLSLLLVTSVTTWWYLRANNAAPTIIALNQPVLVDEPTPVAVETNFTPAPLSLASATNITAPQTLSNPETKPRVLALSPSPNQMAPKAVKRAKSDEVEDDGAEE